MERTEKTINSKHIDNFRSAYSILKWLRYRKRLSRAQMAKVINKISKRHFRRYFFYYNQPVKDDKLVNLLEEDLDFLSEYSEYIDDAAVIVLARIAQRPNSVTEFKHELSKRGLAYE